MTRYVQIVHDRRTFDPNDWTPWKNCKGSARDTALLAAAKFAREAGYARAPGGWGAFEFQVFVADESAPRYANGRFASCVAFVIRISLEKP